VLAGCGDAGAASTGAAATGPGRTGAGDVRGRTFESTRVTEQGAPKAMVPGTSVRLSFTADGFSADAGCNRLSGPARVEGARLVVAGPLMMTEIGCPPALQEQDLWLRGLVSAGAGLVLDGDRLVLTSGTTTVELTERRPEPAPPSVETS